MARKAIQFAHEGTAGVGRSGDDDRVAHVGFYLVDKGRPRLERAVEMRHSSLAVLRRAGRRASLLPYAGTITVTTLFFTTALLAQAYGDGVFGYSLAALAILILLATSQLAVGMVNWVATLLVTPHPLPRMDFSEGLPPESRTLVVVPTMLTCAADIERLVEALEVRFLANRDDQPSFRPADGLPGRVRGEAAR